MTYKEVIKTLEERRENMLNLVENRRNSLPIEKHHQVTGAINELDVVLKTLQHFRDKEGSQERSFEIPESKILNQKTKITDLVDK